MTRCVIRSIEAVDARFPLPEGAGSDVVHRSLPAFGNLPIGGYTSGTGNNGSMSALAEISGQ